MKAKKLLSLLLAMLMVVSLLPATALADEPEEGNWTMSDAIATELTPHVDGTELKVDWYVDCYVANPNWTKDQKVNVYVPETATADSPIVLIVNNSGWQSNNYPNNTIQSYSTGNNGRASGDYSSSGDDRIGAMLSRGFVVVSYGCRSRNNAAVDGEYLGHSPATVSDTKAVIRYLRYNKSIGELPAGDPERIIVTGTSGGGALSTIIAASGNSPDFYDALYEVGAAGITRNPNGGYTSTIGDDVFATIAYCPINDLGHACAGYEWTYMNTRDTLEQFNDSKYDGYDAKAASEALAASYEAYVDSLNLSGVNSDTLKEKVIELMKAEIEDTIAEKIADGKKRTEAIVELVTEVTAASDNKYDDWLAASDNADGYTYNYDQHLLWLATKQALKAVSAFSNAGLPWAGQNEDSLFGTRGQSYSPYNFYSWDNDAKENGVGKDETGKTWDEYMDTADGKLVALQIKMANPVAYLGEYADVDNSPYWYVRHGMADRDTSFGLQTVLYHAMKESGDIEDLNFEFAWLKAHSGNYDVQEAYAWLDDVLDEAGPSVNTPSAIEGQDTTIANADVTYLYPKLDGEKLTVTWYKDRYVSSPNSNQQYVNVYVPDGADASSPIILKVNNSGWQSNSYPNNTIQSYGQVTTTDRNGNVVTQTVGNFSSTGNDEIGAALSRGYIVVSYGCRGRNDAAVNGEYLGHSPATMTDTKAVIRYLRANKNNAMIGNPERICVTGTSGGGALSTVIAASGNSSDYYASLYEIGAAGMTSATTSNIRDDVYATIAYCPINDLGRACAGYEWTYNETRKTMYAAGEMNYATGKYVETATEAAIMAASEALKADYAAYVNGLGLYNADGAKVTDKNLKDAVIALMKAEIEDTIAEKRTAGKTRAAAIDELVAEVTAASNNNYDGWLAASDNADGYTYNYDQHLLWLAKKQALKAAPAFSNLGMNIAGQNEDSLFGRVDQQYSPYNFYAWNNDATAGNGVGTDDTNLTWDQFLTTNDGKLVASQIKMASPIPYLTQEQNKVDSAPYWYVRHGAADRDTSFGLQTVLYYAMKNASDIKNADFEFAWIKGHSGNYDVEEAYAWLDQVMKGTIPTQQPFTAASSGGNGGTGGSGGGSGGPAQPSIRPVDPANPTTPVESNIVGGFVDVKTDAWYADAVKYVQEKGLMNGTSDSSFAPGSTVNRAMVVTVLYRLAGSPSVSGSNGFTDLTQDWYRNAVQWAYDAGITTGTSATTFSPDAQITREQLAAMIYRYAAACGYDVSGRAVLDAFADSASVSAYALDAMQWANEVGLINGLDASTLAPTGDSNRAQLAVILMRFCENIAK